MKNIINGQIGEELATELLKKKAYKILQRNYKNVLGEIDIIAKDKDYLVFVEVKFRNTRMFGRASEAVDKRKQMHIISAARSYLQENRLRRIPRFDVIEVYVEKTDNSFKVVNVNHLPRAFASGR